ncbi:MAG: ABC transporter permease [Candidatus Izimaplasma sp.]|nr:ABC transporter permease [Candidatus Izimaplasma bacterium]
MINQLKNEFLYLLRTKKFIIFFVLFAVFGMISPLTAKYLPEILASLLGNSDIVIDFPEPDIYYGYIQFLSDLNEIVLFVIIFVGISVFIRDKTKGIYPLIFSKPIKRETYLLGKILSYAILLLMALVIGFIFFDIYILILFKDLLFLTSLQMMMLYFLYVIWILSFTLLFSVISKSYLTAALMTFGTYILFVILDIFNEFSIFKYLPNTLNKHISGIIYSTSDTTNLWITILITVGMILIFIYLSIVQFNKQDIIND